MTEVKIGDVLPYRGDETNKWVVNKIRNSMGTTWVNASKDGRCQWFPLAAFTTGPKLMRVNVLVWDSLTTETSGYAFEFKSPSIKIPGSDNTVVFYGAIAKLVHESACATGDESPDDWSATAESNTRIADDVVFAVYKSKIDPTIVTTYHIRIESVGA